MAPDGHFRFADWMTLPSFVSVCALQLCFSLSLTLCHHCKWLRPIEQIYAVKVFGIYLLGKSDSTVLNRIVYIFGAKSVHSVLPNGFSAHIWFIELNEG